MGYRVSYESESCRDSHRKAAGESKLPLIFLAAGLFLGTLITARGRALLKFLLIPGEPDQTLQAVKNLLAALQCGQTVKNALEVFCLTVLEGCYGS